jgi:hypothetical protein
MKKFITIPGFKGGISNSLFDPIEKQTYQSTKGLDVFTHPNILEPLVARGFDAAGSSTSKLFSVTLGSDGYYYFVGNNGAGKYEITRTNTLSASSTLTSMGVSASSAPDTTTPPLGYGLMEYSGYMYARTSTTVASRLLMSGGFTYTDSWQSTLTHFGPMLNHQGLGAAYFAGSNKISKYVETGTAWTAAALTLDSRSWIVSLDAYERWVVIGARQNNLGNLDTGNSKIYLWDGSATTVDDVWDLSDTGLQAVRNVNGTIYALCVNKVSAKYATTRLWKRVGGGWEKVYEMPHGNTIGNLYSTFPIQDSAVEVHNGILYWGYDAKLNSATDTLPIGNYIYAHKNGVTTQYLIPGQGTSNVMVSCFRFLGGRPFIITNDKNSVYKLEHELAVTDGTKISNGVYESNAFALNAGLRAKIRKIYINHEPLPASTGFTVQLRHFGDYPFGSTVTPTKAFTVSIASPGKFTRTAHGFATGDKIRLLTTGALPTGLSTDVTYYVRPDASLTAANEFWVYDTYAHAVAGGSTGRVDTSGSQSGTHTIDPWVDVFGPQGNAATSGLTQSTDNATYTEVSSPDFKECRYAQLRIKFDEVSGTTAPSILFPIIIELDVPETT